MEHSRRHPLAMLSAVVATAVALVVMTSTMEASAGPYTPGCVTHSKHWDVREGSVWIRVASIDAHLHVCNDAKGNLTSASLSVDSGITGTGKADGYEVNVGGPYEQQSATNASTWVADGNARSCFGIGHFALCSKTSRFQVTAQARGPNFIGPYIMFSYHCTSTKCSIRLR